MKKYKFRSDVAISDTAFYAYGKTPAELLENACLAATDAMVTSGRIDEKIEKHLLIRADSFESLLYNALEELIYLKDAKQLVFHSFQAHDAQIEPPQCSVMMIMKGELIDRVKHEAHADVKAVTYQGFAVEKTPDGWRASVVLDI